MKLTKDQINLLKRLMINSAQKGNLANSGMVLENGKIIASAESWVVTKTDATAHSERMLVEAVCKIKQSNYTPGLIMVTVTEPCLMCLSACVWAGYKEICYIIPMKKYIDKIPWMSEAPKADKKKIPFTTPIKITHLGRYEEEFCKVFEKEMKSLLK